MNREEQIIKELNIIFKKRGWGLLPEDNSVFGPPYWGVYVLRNSELYLSRVDFPYKEHLNKYSIKQLDNYIVEFIKHICEKYRITGVHFGSMIKNKWDINIIKL